MFEGLSLSLQHKPQLRTRIKIFNRYNIVIFDINENDGSRILDGINLIELIIEKYEEVRLGL